MNLERPLCFIDIESTGSDPVKDRIVEFAAAILHPDGSRSEWSHRFNPGIPIPPAATEVHHITDADVAECPSFSDQARRIALALIGKDLGGYNLRRFDLPILDEELRRCGIKLDLERISIVDCFGIFSKKQPRKLEDAVRHYCGREHESAHGAIEDAAATLDVFLGQIAAHDDLACMAIEDLDAFSLVGDQKYADIAGKLYRDADGDLVYNFGKHKDEKVRNQPGFAHWMMTKDFPGSTLDVLEAEFERLEKGRAA